MEGGGIEGPKGGGGGRERGGLEKGMALWLFRASTPSCNLLGFVYSAACNCIFTCSY